MKSLILPLLILPGAASGVEDETPIPPADVSRHGMVGERLRLIMEGINHSLPDSGDPDASERAVGRDQMDDMVEAVQELMYFAEFMSMNPPRRDLGDNQIATFRALASQLYTDALSVRDLAQNYDLAAYNFEPLNLAYERMYQSCAACHELFRDY